MTQRTNRIDELIRQEIGEIISRELSDPRIGFVTITDVETTTDLSHAKVWASFIGTPEERTVALRALGHAMPFIRHELGKRLRIRRIPELHLESDETLIRGTRILQLINELGEGTEPSSTSFSEDSLPTPVARLPHEGDAPKMMDEPMAPQRVPSRKGGRRTGNGGRAGSTPASGGRSQSRRRPGR